MGVDGSTSRCFQILKISLNVPLYNSTFTDAVKNLMMVVGVKMPSNGSDLDNLTN